MNAPTLPAEPIARRPLKSRQTRWANALAANLIARRVHPNTISLVSIVCAAAAGLCLGLAPALPPGGRAALYFLAALGIQLRLLCNLLDGMVALGGSRRSRLGDLYNELPDRLADCLILVGTGYALRACAWGSTLGWMAAALALLTAYVRALGGSLGLRQDFTGPMAKPHRMATLTSALIAAGVLLIVHPRADVWLLTFALLLIIIGCLVTLARRIGRIARELERP